MFASFPASVRSDRDQFDPPAIDAERDLTLLQQHGVGAENLTPPAVEAG